MCFWFASLGLRAVVVNFVSVLENMGCLGMPFICIIGICLLWQSHRNSQGQLECTYGSSKLVLGQFGCELLGCLNAS